MEMPRKVASTLIPDQAYMGSLGPTAALWAGLANLPLGLISVPQIPLSGSLSYILMANRLFLLAEASSQLLKHSSAMGCSTMLGYSTRP